MYLTSASHEINAITLTSIIGTLTESRGAEDRGQDLVTSRQTGNSLHIIKKLQLLKPIQLQRWFYKHTRLATCSYSAL